MNGVAHDLRVEHLDRPLGILSPAPRLSWKLPAGSARQVAYRLRADNGWDTGTICGGRSLLVPYDGRNLRPAERLTWQVKVWTRGLGCTSPRTASTKLSSTARGSATTS
jgi:alpha-L-rhamnosidase